MSIEKLFSLIDASNGTVKLLPISKGHSSRQILAQMKQLKLPQRLGENYLEEMQQKAREIPGVEWHYLGRLQSRKIDDICKVAHVIHTVSRVKELERIAKHSRVKFFIQVNISGEEQKNGCEESQLAAMKKCIEDIGLGDRWMGLMGMAAPIETAGRVEVKKSFAKLRALRDEFCPSKELSMGMTSDYEIAIEEGANWLRIGTLLFGSRE